ncbi:MDR family MFS transporter [Lacticaseibacillus songhuajiangensis]|jgi:MFS family permease|uniref:MDR family MFS transporter n=1 Tax=Lacticaseibacillus songhuajiangensis TaxID=1296539 RepID=UPI0013DE5680|nr:MFS transporter [Lacticaseibacillus songhuajiangensis]
MMMRANVPQLKLRWLFLGYLITNTGASFIWPLTTIYMHEYLGESLTTAGVVLFFNSLFMVIGSAVGGKLFDTWREDVTILLGIALTTGATGLLVFLHGWPAFPILLVISGFGSGMVVTAINGFATRITTRRASFIFNVMYFISNLGLVFGTLGVGFLLPLGISYVFATAFFMYLLFLIIAWFEYRGKNRPHKARAAQAKERIHLKLPVITVLLTLVLVWVFYEQWQSNISAFMLSRGLKIRDYSFLWTVNAILIVTFQPLLTAFDEWLTKHLRGRLYFGFALLASSFLILLVAKQYYFFIIAMAVLTLGEIIALPAVSTFVDQFAPESQKGRYQGMVQSCASAGRAIGPLIGALLIDSFSYHWLFIAATVVILMSTAAFAFSNLLARKPQDAKD